ncbi:MAG: Slp family lipoprotein [Idiomarina sp.]|nr:Slp family lipoprotein [Idiomarina sp.]
MQQAMKYILMAAAAVVITGCAARYPEPIRTDATNLVEFSAAQRNAEAHQGQTARWGGVIAQVENSEQRTRIEVVNFRLNNFGRPQTGDQSAGRFVVYLDHFVDPEIYQRGRRITALGQFSGLEQGQIGEFNYHYPVIQASGVELWREQVHSPSLMHPAYGYYDPHSLWYRNHIYGFGPYRYYYHPHYYHPWGATPRRIQRPQPNPPAQQPPRQPRSPQGVIRQNQEQH